MVQALKLAIFGPTQFPAPPVDVAFERKLAEAAAVAEGARLLAQQARDVRILAVVALQAAKTSAEAERLAAALRAAEEADLAAEQEWSRSGRVVQRLQRQIAARQRAAVTEQAP